MSNQLESPSLTQTTHLSDAMAADVAMTDMDIDFTMDEEVDPEIARLQAEADAINAVGERRQRDHCDVD